MTQNEATKVVIGIPERAVKPLTTEGAGRLVNIQPPPMLIEGLIPRGALVLVAGPTYSGKTFFALELAKAVATGEPFMGEFKVAHRGNVLVVEQDAPRYDTGQVMWSMLKKTWNEETQAERDQQRFSILDPLYFTWHPNIDLKQRLDIARIAATARGLHTFRGEGVETTFTPRWDEQTGAMLDTGKQVEYTDFAYRGAALIVLDTLSALAMSAKENERDDMEPIMQGLKLLRASTNATVVLIHHDNAAATRLRGSTAIDGAVDNWFAIKKNQKLGLSSCVVKKARAIQAPSFRFRIETKEDPDLGTIKSVVFASEIDPNDPDKIETGGPDAKTMLLNFLLSQEKGIMLEAVVEWGVVQEISETTIRRYLKAMYEEGTAHKQYIQDGRIKKVRVHAAKNSA